MTIKNRRLLKEVNWENVVMEESWGRPIKTFEYKGDLYISETAFKYWSVQSNIISMLAGIGADEYDGLYAAFRDIVLEYYSVKELKDIVYNMKDIFYNVVKEE